MANTIVKTTLVDGAKNLVVLVNIAGDGSGEENGTLLIDRSAYANTAGLKLVMRKIEGDLSGFTARLLFDATTDLEIAQLPDAHQFCYDWKKIGGLASPKAGAGYNGDVLISTLGLGAGDRGTFTLEMWKKGP